MIGNERILRKMSVGDILDYSIELYKRNFKKLFMLSLVLYVPFILIYTAVISYMTGDLFKAAGIDYITNSIEDTPDPEAAMYKFIAYFIVIALMGLLYIAFSITLQPVLDASVTQIIYNDAVNGKSISWKDASKKSFKYFGKLLLNRLLYGLILYGIITVAIIVFYIIIFAVFFTSIVTINEGIEGSGTSGVFMGILIAIFVIAGLLGILIFIGYFAMRFGLGTQSVIIENTSASKAISRSHEITSKKFWHSGLTVVIALIMISFLPTLMAYCIYFLLYIDKGLYAAANAAVQVISAIVHPFITVVLTMVFIDLKVRKEGLDLEVKVDTMLEEERTRNELLKAGETLNA